MRYFRNEWDELRGDSYDSWGSCVYYFEIDDEGYPVRQVEVYENGNSINYDREGKQGDEYGSLGDQPLPLAEMDFEAISEEEFEELWKRSGTTGGGRP